MTVLEFISTIPPERQAIFTTFHEAILANDPTVIPVVKLMMGKEMILYEDRCHMKYGLANAKKHMSFHCLPIYMNPVLHAKYVDLLPAAKVQKGCINFTDEEDLSVGVFVELIVDCSSVDIAAMLENRKKK